jgi:hypothetical protein
MKLHHNNITLSGAIVILVLALVSFKVTNSEMVISSSTSSKSKSNRYIKLIRVGDRLFVANIMINDAQAICLVDTGSQNSYLDSSLVRKSELKWLKHEYDIVTPKSASPIKGRLKCISSNVIIGEKKCVSPIEFLEIDMQRFNAELGKYDNYSIVQGIIGNDLLIHFNVVLDIKAEKLYYE